MVTSTIYSNQGTPEVYVDDVYVGKINNGSLTYSHLPYDKDVTVTLENCSSKDSEEAIKYYSELGEDKIYSGSGQSFDYVRNISSISTSFMYVPYMTMRNEEVETKSYSINTSGTLYISGSSCSISYIESISSRTVNYGIGNNNNTMYYMTYNGNIPEGQPTNRIAIILRGYSGLDVKIVTDGSTRNNIVGSIIYTGSSSDFSSQDRSIFLAYEYYEGSSLIDTSNVNIIYRLQS